MKSFSKSLFEAALVATFAMTGVNAFSATDLLAPDGSFEGGIYGSGNNWGHSIGAESVLTNTFVNGAVGNVGTALCAGSTNCVSNYGFVTSDAGDESILTHEISLIAAQTYTVDFFARGIGDVKIEPGYVLTGLLGSDVNSQSNIFGVNTGNTDGFSEYSFSFTATATQVGSIFFKTTNVNGLSLDRVSVVQNVASAVPEPETYAMMLAGLGAMGFMARRRKSKSA